MARSSRILAFGRHAPARRVANAELEARLGLETGWIERRTGIRARRYAAADEALTDIARPAAAAALNASGIDRADIALTLLATSTPDHLLPPSAPLLAHGLGLSHSGAVDLAGACAGFPYALALADGFVRVHGRPALVVAANILSRRINPDDKVSAVLFADAAGACVLAPCEDEGMGVLGADLSSDGAHYDLIRIAGGGSRRPYAPDMPPAELFMEIADGRAVFSQAVSTMTQSARAALGAAGLAARDVTRFVPHQANTRIFEAVRRNLGLEEERVVSTIAEFGNSSAATIPFSLAASAEATPFRAGERVLLTAVGAGLTGGALVVGF